MVNLPSFSISLCDIYVPKILIKEILKQNIEKNHHLIKSSGVDCSQRYTAIMTLTEHTHSLSQSFRSFMNRHDAL